MAIILAIASRFLIYFGIVTPSDLGDLHLA